MANSEQTYNWDHPVGQMLACEGHGIYFNCKWSLVINIYYEWPLKKEHAVYMYEVQLCFSL